MMLGLRGQNILKILHLLTVCYWLGGALSLITLTYFDLLPRSTEEFYGIRRAYNYIAFIVVGNIGSYGTLFTGLAYSVCTNRGFFRHKWIILKWVITLFGIIIGMTILGPWNAEILESIQNRGISVQSDPIFIASQERYMFFSTLLMVLFILATIISVFKPWEQQEMQEYQKTIKKTLK